MNNRLPWKLIPFLASGILASTVVLAQEQPRVRISIDNDWRFTKDDPPGTDSATLLYDVRPVLTAKDERERPPDATYAPSPLGVATRPVLKPWILPSGNAFIKDPAKRFVRPVGNPGAGVPYVQANYDDSKWRKLDLPHDWAVEGNFGDEHVGGGMGMLPSPGIGWYRKKLDIPATDAGKSIYLEVDGAMSYAEVWLNGMLVGGWPYGYASWQLNLTPYVKPGGLNELAIRLEALPESSRWYPGAGIYRNVWLTKAKPIHVGRWGTQVTTPVVSAASATVDLNVTVDNDSKAASDVDVRTDLYPLDANGKPTGEAVATTKPVSVSIPAGAHVAVATSAVVHNPKLWGPPPLQSPNRYVAVTTILRAGKALDRYETHFGIRKIEYRSDGLYVNDAHVYIQGVNQHHDLGALGSAYNERAAERQLQELQEMGCNAIRMSHNPPAPELLELTDRMGFLVMDEIFDAWIRQKPPFDFHLIFPEWHEQDLRAMIERDRNHPSVFLWSVGNEVGEQNRPEGVKIARDLVSIAHEEDSTRPATASMNSAKADSPFPAELGVISLNYQGEGIRNTPEFENYKGLRKPSQYDAFHKAFPDRMIISSENAATISTRDVYLFPVASGISIHAVDGNGSDSKTHQVSSYEIYTPAFGSSPDKVFAAQDSHPYIAGGFVWTGWDYLGEPSFSSSRSSSYGIIDLAGFKKNRFYLYQAHWRPDFPMAHILPHWTWPDGVGKVTSVHVFTSGDEAELFLNGKSLGRKKKGPYEYRLRWDDVVYQPGTLKVVAYRDGKPWATDEVSTASKASQLKVESDTDHLRADGKDLAFITVTIVDKQGVWNPLADNRVHFTIEGPGEIVATDNGDHNDMEAFHSHDRDAFHGKCLLIVRSEEGQSGQISIKASSHGLEVGKAAITALKN